MSGSVSGQQCTEVNTVNANEGAAFAGRYIWLKAQVMVNTAQRCYQRKHTQSNGCQKEMSFVSYFWLQRRWKIRLLIKDLRHWYAGSKGNTWDFYFKCFLLSHRLTVFLTKLGSYIIIGRFVSQLHTATSIHKVKWIFISCLVICLLHTAYHIYLMQRRSLQG